VETTNKTRKREARANFDRERRHIVNKMPNTPLAWISSEVVREAKINRSEDSNSKSRDNGAASIVIPFFQTYQTTERIEIKVVLG
jgi:hypothetical protein